MSYMPSMHQLRGLSYETASLFGMPHIGARYFREDINCTEWEGDTRRCAFCGRATGAHSKHHEPPRSKGSFLLATPIGSFVLMPALIDLCGSGTTGCHGDRHNGRLKIRWKWDSDEFAEMWWQGAFLKKGMAPNGKWLFGYGRYVFERNGRTFEYREDI